MRYIVKKENAETIYISGGIFVSNGKWTHPKMILDDYELVIVLKGRFQMRIGQARKEFLEGDCFILFPGEEHIGIEAAWDVSFYWLHFRIRDVEVLEDGSTVLTNLALYDHEKGLSLMADKGKFLAI